MCGCLASKFICASSAKSLSWCGTPGLAFESSSSDTFLEESLQCLPLEKDRVGLPPGDNYSNALGIGPFERQVGRCS